MPKEKKPRHYTCAQCAAGRLRYWRWVKAEPVTVTFPTTDDLDKHLREQHRSSMHRCTAVGCFKGQSAAMFQKSETLTQHIKETHKADTIFFCPLDTCDFGPARIDDLAVHAHWKHPWKTWEFSLGVHSQLSPFANAATWMYFRCPVWNCRQIFSNDYEKVCTHLATHSDVEVQGAKDQLIQDGYEIRHISGGVNRTGADQVFLVQIVCLACEARCASDAKFRDHLAASHILASTPGTMEHFRAWRGDIVAWSASQSKKYNSEVPCWIQEFVWLRRPDRGTGSRRCSACSFELRQPGDGDRHPSLLRAVEDVITELLPHRMSILRHYPAFIRHPTFESSLQ